MTAIPLRSTRPAQPPERHVRRLPTEGGAKIFHGPASSSPRWGRCRRTVVRALIAGRTGTHLPSWSPQQRGVPSGEAVVIVPGRPGRLGVGLFATAALLMLGAAPSDAAVPTAAVPTAAVPIAAVPTAVVPGCSAVATVQSQWGAGTPWAGEVITVTVRNTS